VCRATQHHGAGVDQLTETLSGEGLHRAKQLPLQVFDRRRGVPVKLAVDQGLARANRARV
jgi:hypothetical protein